MQQYYTLDDNNNTNIDRLLIYYANYSRGEVASFQNFYSNVRYSLKTLKYICFPFIIYIVIYG